MGNRVYAQGIINVSVQLNAHDCPTCGVVYAISQEFEDRKQDTGDGWHCPNGHSIVFTTSIRARNKQLKEEATRLTAQLDQAWATVGDREKEIKRMKRRATAGVCQFCRRNFANVARHVERKHPSQKDRKATE